MAERKSKSGNESTKRRSRGKNSAKKRSSGKKASTKKASSGKKTASSSTARGAASGGSRRPGVTNADIARALREMALYLEMDEVPFKPRAYEKAAYAVSELERPVADLYEEGGLAVLQKVPGLGKRIAERVVELATEGHLSDLEDLRRETPVDVLGLTAVEGLGPKAAKALYEELGIRNVSDLERAAQDGKIREVPHFGEKSEEKILRGLQFLRQAKGRQPLGEVLDMARDVVGRLRELDHVERADVAGSVRRHRETVGDVDFLVVSKDPEAVMAFFVDMPEVQGVHAHGETKTMVRLKSGIDADLRVVPAESYGAALNYFTGSKAHNVALRTLAHQHGWKLNEYGLFEGEHRLAGQTEEELYEALGLAYVPPELREDRGEVEAAREGELPELIEYGDLEGDLQIQTSWTDGANSIEEMAEAAREAGLTYIAITDHTRDLPMTGGNDEKRLLEEAEAIRELDRRIDGFRILTGAEVNIRKDGSLDVDDEALADLDVVGIGVHTHFHMPRDEMTRRLVKAVQHPHAHILFHPTARILGKRPALDADWDAVFRAAADAGTAIEVNAQPERMDLRDEDVRRALEAGLSLVISSDAHSVQGYRFLDDFGVATARRGWATRDAVLNTRPVDDFLRALHGR